MKLKNFEAFLFEEEENEAPAPEKQKIFIYKIVRDDKRDFLAEIRDENGKVVFKIDQKKMEDGIMTSQTDLSNLRTHLVDKKIIGQNDEITPEEGVTMEQPDANVSMDREIKNS